MFTMYIIFDGQVYRVEEFTNWTLVDPMDDEYDTALAYIYGGHWA